MASDPRVRFGVSGFPFGLCRLALFCCPPLAANLEPRRTDARMSEFATRARRVNRFVQPLMMLGDGSAASWTPIIALLSDVAAGRLARDVGDWYKAHNYTGVVLRWPEATLTTPWRIVAPLLRGLAQRLDSARRHIRLGVALRQDSYGPDLKHIVSSLGKVSIFLLPPAMPQNKFYGHTIRFYSQTTLDTLYSLNLRFLSRNVADHLCYLFPADTYTYRVKPPDTTQSLGPGIQGDVTKHAGRIAYFETCLIASTYSKHVTDYGVEALRADSFLAYTEPQLLGRFVDDMHKKASATCVGIWNPQMDDFGGLCGLGKYPLTSATFRFYNDTHH
ncbi:probable chitinase 10 [Dermacentor andersoni]|uniref:probable chitinase 10 n=1 Tax=Dermacentor andersoni TaxID=34620 RepID=UPI0024164B1D|nr:probable chitinase 10 [Dermacentor andersoni]